MNCRLVEELSRWEPMRLQQGVRYGFAPDRGPLPPMGGSFVWRSERVGDRIFTQLWPLTGIEG